MDLLPANSSPAGMVPSGSSVGIQSCGLPAQSTFDSNSNPAQAGILREHLQEGMNRSVRALAVPSVLNSSPAPTTPTATLCRCCRMPFCQPYSAEYLQLKLSEIAMEGRTLKEVEFDVRNICGIEGIVLTTFKSTSVPDGSGTRYDMKTFRCQKGGTNRQQYYQYSQDDAPAKRRRASQSKCIGCRFEVTIRHAKSHPHPKLTNLKLVHNHLLDRDAMAMKLRLGGKPAGQLAEQAGKMAAKGMKPKDITTALTTLSLAPVNHRAVENHSAAQTGAERPMDAPDFDEEVGGPTLQDQQVLLYADVSKILNEASSILSESGSPAEALAMADLFLQKVKIFSGTSEGEPLCRVYRPPSQRSPASAVK